jgi:hypothetical protein
MKQRPRIYYTEADKSLMWDRWQKGSDVSVRLNDFSASFSSPAPLAAVNMLAQDT